MLFLKLFVSLCILVFGSKMLIQELMIGKCEDVETKASCWTRDLVTI